MGAKKVNWYDKQQVDVEDMDAEQAYVIGRPRDALYRIFNDGVASGLVVQDDSSMATQTLYDSADSTLQNTSDAVFQIFKSLTNNLQEVIIRAAKSAGATGILRIGIHNLSNPSDPNSAVGSVISEADVSIASLSTSSAEITFDFNTETVGTPGQLTVDNYYAIKVSTPVNTGTVNVDFNSTSGYSDGFLAREVSGSYTAYANQDLYFKIYSASIRVTAGYAFKLGKPITVSSTQRRVNFSSNISGVTNYVSIKFTETETDVETNPRTGETEYARVEDGFTIQVTTSQPAYNDADWVLLGSVAIDGSYPLTITDARPRLPNHTIINYNELFEVFGKIKGEDIEISQGTSEFMKTQLVGQLKLILGDDSPNKDVMVEIAGDLLVSGSEIIVNTETMLIANNRLVLNADTTDDTGVLGNRDAAVEVKRLDDETQSNRGVDSFVSTDNIVMQNGSHGISAGDYVEVTNATTSDNDGNYKVDSLATTNVANDTLIVDTTYKAVDTPESGKPANATRVAKEFNAKLMWDESELSWKIGVYNTSTGSYDFAYLSKDNVTASAPTVTDDADSGYNKFSRWIDTSANNKLYFCKDATAGAAVWEEAGGGGGVGIEAIELKSHLEKDNNNYPLGNTAYLNESFNNNQNVDINLFDDYSSGTTIYLDKNMTLIDDAEAVGTVWDYYDVSPATGNATIDAVNYKENSNSVKHTFTTATVESGLRYIFASESSLSQRKLRVWVRLDTLTNIPYIRITLWNETGRTNGIYWNKTTQADGSALVAGWNFIEVDVDNDATDGSAGTFTSTFIKYIEIGTVPSASQTFTINADFLRHVDVDDFLLPMIYTIYDSSNFELMYIVSGSNGKYTLQSSLNSYSITSPSDYTSVISKQRNINILLGGKRGEFISGLSGTAALETYDLTRKQLPINVSAGTLKWSQRWYDDQFAVISFPSSTTLKISGNYASFFKQDDQIIMFKRVFNGIEYDSPIDSIIGANFKIMTLSIDSAYAGGETTLTHTGYDNTNDDNDNWYVARYSVEFEYFIGTRTASKSLSEPTPTIFIPNRNSINYYPGIVAHYKLDEVSGDAVDSYGGLDYTERGTVPTQDGIFDRGRGATSLSNVFAVSLADLGGTHAALRFSSKIIMVEAWIKTSDTTASQFTIASDFYTTGANYTGWEIKLDSSHYFNFYFGKGASATSLTYSVALNDGNWHYVVGVNAATSGTGNMRIYVDGVLRNSTNGQNWTLGSYDTYIGASSGAGTGVWNSPFPGVIDDVVFWNQYTFASFTELEDYISLRWNNGLGRQLGGGGGFIMGGSVDNVSGNEIVTASKITRKDSSNQNPKIYQRDSIIIT